MSTISSRSMAASVALRRRPAPIPGPLSRSSALRSDSRPTSISRTAECFRPSPFNPTCRGRSQTRRWPRRPTTRSSRRARAGRGRNARAARGSAVRKGARRHALARVSPDIMGYVGGYYQWDNNWKFTGRLGVQSFGGAQILNLHSVSALHPADPEAGPRPHGRRRQPPVRGHRADRWTPKPSYQLTLRTPLYAIKN